MTAYPGGTLRRQCGDQMGAAIRVSGDAEPSRAVGRRVLPADLYAIPDPSDRSLRSRSDGTPGVPRQGSPRIANTYPTTTPDQPDTSTRRDLRGKPMLALEDAS